MNDPLFNLDGKIALVTGATSGIGQMIARGLISRGVKTYISGRDPGQAAARAAELCAGGGVCLGLAADLSDPAGPRRLAETFRLHEQRLDLLVNNAGTVGPGTLQEMTPADWDHVMGVNVRACFFMVQQLLPQLRAGGAIEHPARVINVGSIGGLHVPNWEAHGYGASKAALHHLTRSLAKALGRERITVNAIAPGPFPSRMNDTTSEAMQKSIATYIPLQRAGEADDVIGAVVFLASRAGAYVNGTTIPLDGGYLAAL